MIVINNKKWKIDEIGIEWDEFSQTVKKRELKGISPYFSFMLIDNDGERIFFTIETTYPREYFHNLKENREIDFAPFISDIYLFKSKISDGVSIIDGYYTSTLSKIFEEQYFLKFNLNYDDEELHLRVQIEEKIEIA